MSAARFSIAEAEERLGPAAAEEAKRSAAEAPRFRPEQIEHLRALFASAVVLGQTPPPAAKAA
ncbi:AMMECR1 domain-containing protein [Streptomyces ambofaciens]